MLGIETRGKKPTVVLTQTQDPLLPLHPPKTWQFPMPFVSKLRAQTLSLGNGGDFQSPVRHPAPCLPLDIPMDACCNSHHEANTAFNASETQKDGSPFLSPHCKSQILSVPGDERSAEQSEAAHKYSCRHLSDCCKVKFKSRMFG